MLKRREFLATAAASTAITSAGLRAAAATQLDLGAAQLTTLSDGFLSLPRSFLLGGLPEDQLALVLQSYGITGDVLTSPCNVTLYQDGTNTVLFDAGSGTGFMPSAGALPEALDLLGVELDSITHVVFTHAHPDHLWGVLDDFDDPLFPEATYMIGLDEWKYWTNPATVDSIGADRASFAVGAARRLEAIEDSLTFFAPDQEILPGVASVASFGHTPGHMSFEVRNGSQSVMVVGDAIGNGHVALARPDWPSGSDQDPETGIATRAALLDRLAAEKMPFVGFHLPDGGLGRVERRNGGYHFVTEGL